MPLHLASKEGHLECRMPAESVLIGHGANVKFYTVDAKDNEDFRIGVPVFTCLCFSESFKFSPLFTRRRLYRLMASCSTTSTLQAATQDETTYAP